MDLEQTITDLQSKNEYLGHENDLFKTMFSVVKENLDLRARMQLSSIDALQDEPAAGLSSRIHPSRLLQSANETQFRQDMQQTEFQQQQRTSSPVDFQSFVQNSVLMDTKERAELRSVQEDRSLEVKDATRLLGEVAYQLDRRILFYIFQNHRRLYGFTLHNIPEKIREVSTHPVTGKLDEGYQLYLTKRHTELMKRLNQLGYITELHPLFSEFIINTYGILKERPCDNSTQKMDYNNPDFLRKVIISTALTRLQKDLLIMLNCLSMMAKEEKKSLFLW